MSEATPVTAVSDPPKPDLASFATTECTVCTHPEAPAIDEALLGGTALRSVAGTFGLSRSAVHRHRQNHLSVQAITEPDPDVQRPALRLVDVHGQLTGLCDRLEKVVELSTRTRKPAAAVQAMRELRQCLEAIARLQADPVLRQASSLQELKQWTEEVGGDALVRMLDFVLSAFGSTFSARGGGESEQQRIVAKLMAACLRDLGASGVTSTFADVDTSQALAFVEERTLAETGRMEAEVQRRVEAELRRREAQPRPAIGARSPLAIENVRPSWRS